MWQITGKRMREKALWGREVRGHPAKTTTAKRRGEKRESSAGGGRKRRDRKGSLKLFTGRQENSHWPGKISLK